MDAGKHDLDTGVGEDGVEGFRVFAVAIADDAAGSAASARVVQIHGKVAHGATDWTRLGNNLPATVAVDVEYSATDDTVYVATHGRGIWRINNPDAGS